jgi:nucleoid-associated protein YgaU
LPQLAGRANPLRESALPENNAPAPDGRGMPPQELNIYSPPQAGLATASSSTEAGRAVSPAGLTAPDTCVVQPNDSYWTISQRVYGTGAYFKALAAHNQQRYPQAERLRTGDVLSVPPADFLAQNYPDLCPRAERVQQIMRTASVEVPRHEGSRLYTVQEGDTLFDIARYELGKAVRWIDIYELNRNTIGDDFNYLRPGMQLLLPVDGPLEKFTRAPSETQR